MPLTFAKTGEENFIKKINGKDDTKRFLESLGFVVGSSVTVVSELGGNMILNVKDARIALDKSMASRILIWDVYYTKIFLEVKMKTLKTTNMGETVTVLKLEGEGAIKRRIMDMGITKGASLFVRKVAPLGDPIEITVRGYELSLRKADAEKIIVE